MLLLTGMTFQTQNLIQKYFKSSTIGRSFKWKRYRFEDSVAGIQAANIANMISVGIGDATVLHEAKYNF